MIRPFLCACYLLGAGPALALGPGPSPAPGGGFRPGHPAPYKIGLKLGSGVGYINNTEAPPTWTAFTGGLSVAYRPERANFFSSIQLDALLERRTARPWQPADANNLALFVPLYLRTDPDKDWFHLIVGAGPTFWLSGQEVPRDQSYSYATRAVEATLLTGVELRVLPLGRYETTLALTYRFSLSPDLVRTRYSPTGAATQDEYKHRWIGATLNVYLHPGYRPGQR